MPLKIEDLLSLQVDAVDAKVFIFNLRSISQAERREFDPRLPLQILKSC
jgi:hypothetical protein